MFVFIKRSIDIIFAISLLPLILILLGIFFVLIKFTSKGPFIFWSDRIGKNSLIFSMPKIRTMHINTPQKATHLLKNPEDCLVKFGSFLRKTSLDEMPQIFLILKGKMSIVGPRPALFNQLDLISLRKNKGIDILKPGLTGWAQVNGRDNISINEKVNLDEYYFQNKSILLDMKIILLSIYVVFKRKSISH